MSGAERRTGMSILLRSLLYTLATMVIINTVAYLVFVSGANSHFAPGPGPDMGPGIGPPPGSMQPPPRLPPPFETRLWSRWLEVLGADAIVLLPLTMLFAHSLTAPLRRLADAAASGETGSAAPLAREGPAEVRLAIDRFNAMQGRLNNLIQQRTQMVGAIAHDLRTPLTRLAFRLDDLPPPLGEKVRADIEEMKSMISAALEFIRDRSVQGHFERLDLRSLVERVTEELSDLGHDVTLESGSPMSVEGASLALRRMVANLIENALKYGQRARVCLWAESHRCTLQIDDDGPGIPEGLQAQVFDPFFRIEGSRNRQTGGIGLGLATVRAIVIEHDGEIRLANRREGGLRVTVLLPIVT